MTVQLIIQITLYQTSHSLKIVNHDKNLGLSFARNSGINHSNSDYIIFIDSDIVISNHWIDSMYKSIHRNENIIGINGDMGSYPNKKLSNGR